MARTQSRVYLRPRGDGELDLLIAVIKVAHRDAGRGPVANKHYASAVAFLRAAGAPDVPAEHHLRAQPSRGQRPKQ